MLISVIIPTYNRAGILGKTLQAYADQNAHDQMLEMLVVDDGSNDQTRSVVEKCSRCFPAPLHYFHQQNQGLAAARNHAIREAKGSILLFGDDDIMPSPHMISEHAVWHQTHTEQSVGVLGYVTWAPEVRPTPFMEWAGMYGPQFNFGYFTPGMELGFQYGYFCNTSVKSTFLRDNGIFNESFRSYGWEDIELSYRLGKKGYRLLYNPGAVGYHLKHERFEDTRRRIESLYASWPTFAKTEAGEHFLEIWHIHTAGSARGMKAMVKKTLKPLKALAMPLLKPIIDTRLPLPNKIYDMVFYHYVTPFSVFIEKARQGSS